MDVLEVEGLVKRLGDKTVVDGVGFRVEGGEFFVLLGPSGGGKSTLLRLLCGLEQPDAGTIAVNGRDITRLPPRERNLGMVFQDYGLYPNMNVFQNIAYGLEARGGLSRNEIEGRVSAAAEALGLGGYLKRSIVDLSGGEQQRVALARALAKDADAYLFDEPLSNLDPKLRHRARRDIMAMHRQKQKPSVYVTHDQTEAFAIGDRIAILAHGHLQQVGTGDDLTADPANLFVARFVGSPPMNVLPARLDRAPDRDRLLAAGWALTLPARWRAALDRYGAERVVVGIRPEALSRANGDATTDNVLLAEVTEVEPLVGESVVTIRAGEHRLTAALPDDGEAAPPVPGEPLRLVVDVDRVRLFDPESEQAVPVSAVAS